MKKLIVLLIVCFAFIGCNTKLDNSYNRALSIIPPGSSNFQMTDKDYWYSFTRNNIKYLIHYQTGQYDKRIIIIEDK